MVEYALGKEPLNSIHMKKMLLLFIIASCWGCTNVSNKSLSASEYQDLLKQTILPIPDSLLTDEQIHLKIKLLDLLCQHVYVEDNCQKLAIDKKMFEKESIPTIYHDVIKYQLEQTNKATIQMIETDEVPSEHLEMDSLMKMYKIRYWEEVRPELLNRLNIK